MTIAEIAKLAGTSRGTVDRVLNGRGKVNKELEKKASEFERNRPYNRLINAPQTLLTDESRGPGEEFENRNYEN